MPLFELEDAVVQYNGVPVLNNISLKIEPGEKVAFVGQSGAGKSTLPTLLYEQHNNDTALVPQELGLVRALTVFHNIYMGRLHRHPTWYNVANLVRPFKKEIEAMRPTVEKIGLEDQIFQRVEKLSGGQQQRVAVARAIAGKPALVLADEPTANVDLSNQQTILDLIRSACTADNVSLLLVTHSISVAEQFDRIERLDEFNTAATLMPEGTP